MGNNLCCSDNADLCGNTRDTTENFSLKSFRKKALPVQGNFYVTIKEIQMSR
jgi:hypothetical protein